MRGPLARRAVALPALAPFALAPFALALLALALLAACDDPVRPEAAAARPAAARVPTDDALHGAPYASRLIDFGTFGAWEPVLDPTFDSGPTTDGTFIVARGMDARLYATRPEYDAAVGRYVQGPWRPVGDGLTSRPAIATYPVFQKRDGKREPYPPYTLGDAVAARRDDGNLWVASRSPLTDAWTAWHPLPAGAFGAPAIAYAHPYLYVVARARDGALYWTRNRWDLYQDVVPGTGWSTWQRVPGDAVSSDPGAVGSPGAFYWYDWVPSALHIVATRNDGRVWRNRMEDRGTFVYSGWLPIPGGITGHAPSIGGEPTRRMDLAVRGVFDDAVWLTSSEDGGATWTPYQSIGGVVASPPAVWSLGDVEVSVVARGTDSRIWHRSTRPR